MNWDRRAVVLASRRRRATSSRRSRSRAAPGGRAFRSALSVTSRSPGRGPGRLAAGLRWPRRRWRWPRPTAGPRTRWSCGFATGAMTSLWLGRLDEVERWLERAERRARAESPAASCSSTACEASLRLVQGRPEEALAASAKPSARRPLLASEHALDVGYAGRLAAGAGRAWRHGRGARRARGSAERARPPTCGSPPRSSPRRGRPEEAVDVLAPVHRRHGAGALHRPSGDGRGAVLDAVARERSATAAPRKGRWSGRST